MAILIADVVGHGVAAALLMAKLSSESRFCLAIEHEPAKVMARLNAKLCDDALDDRFVTLVMAVLHPTSHELVVVNAGHMAPILCTGDGEVLEIGSAQSGLPLGIVRDIEYQQYPMQLAMGQTFAMFTDGLTEAMNESGELYGLERLRRRAAAGVSSPRALVKRLIRDVQDFLGQCAPGDDMCIVCFGREEPSLVPDADSSMHDDLEEEPRAERE